MLLCMNLLKLMKYSHEILKNMLQTGAVSFRSSGRMTGTGKLMEGEEWKSAIEDWPADALIDSGI